MDVTIELKPEDEAALIKMAAEANLSLNDFVNNLFREHFADYLATYSDPDKTEYRKHLEEKYL